MIETNSMFQWNQLFGKDVFSRFHMSQLVVLTSVSLEPFRELQQLVHWPCCAIFAITREPLKWHPPIRYCKKGIVTAHLLRCCRWICDIIWDLKPGKSRVAIKSSRYVQKRVEKFTNTLEKFILHEKCPPRHKDCKKFTNIIVQIFGAQRAICWFLRGVFVICHMNQFISPVPNTKKSESCWTCSHPRPITYYQISSRNKKKKSYGNLNLKNC